MDIILWVFAIVAAFVIYCYVVTKNVILLQGFAAMISLFVFTIGLIALAP